jgi:DNA-binding MarR family transcriptional regulator/GNAT superfamily N-acetyltransferase
MRATDNLSGDVLAVRRFNRFYTRQIGVLKRGLLDSAFTLTEVRVLYELAHADDAKSADNVESHGGLTASELCELLDVDASYLSRILRSFESKGLIAKHASTQDRRATHLHLTAKGREAFAPLEAASSEETAHMLATVTPNDRANLLASMRQIETTLAYAATPLRSVDATEKYRLRPHRPGDMGWVIARHGALYHQEYGWDGTFEALVAEICAKFINEFDATRERCWIAEDDAGPLGCIFLVRKTDATAKLRMLLVEPRARGLGLGNRLVDECLAFAREAGYKKVTLWTNDILHTARRIYVERGFKLIREEKHRSFGHDLVGQHWDLKL